MEMTEGLESDLSQLDDLSEENILNRLKARYNRDLIYTSIKDILIAVNPCKPLKLYDENIHNDYNWDSFNPNLQPHVFQVAGSAYRRMRETETNQVIIVSGESGAGKTESTKHMVRHVVHMCGKGQMDLHDKIVAINPLLESFGNAKTVMNSNSSRFAKYLELSFKDEGQLAGAVVRDYMLEKSRVVHQNDGEGIFHIFYALFAGCPRETRNDLFLNSQSGEYRIMRSDIDSLDMDVHYRKMYEDNMDILNKIHVDTHILHVMMAAVINITEVEFTENDKGVAEIIDAAPYVHAAILLELDEEDFAHSLIASKRVVRDQTIVTYKNLKQARDSRDALAKMLYERMFGWLIRQINIDLHPNRLGTTIFASIGILDIAGFEKLRHNSIEQMCINLVNEKLQNFMNERIFNIEMSIYKQEGVEMEGISFTNNDDTLAMFEKPKVGILAILDEVTNFMQGTDQSFVHQLKKDLASDSHFTEVQGDRPEFFIHHFAAQVCYDASGFIEKNRDRLNDELMQCMMASKDEFISDLFTVKRGPTGTISCQNRNYRQSRRAQGVAVMPHGKAKLKPTPKGAMLAAELGKSLKKKFGIVQKPDEGMTRVAPAANHKTLTSYFKASLLDLLEKLKSAEPYFVRCIKANHNLVPDDFEDIVVSDQLKYNGLSQVAKIRKMGFAVRKSYNDFNRRYQVLLPPVKRGETDKDIAREILLMAPADWHRDFRCGKTRVFMTTELSHWVEQLYFLRRKHAGKIITLFGRNTLKKLREEKRRREEAERARQLEEERRRRDEEEERKEDKTNAKTDFAATLPAPQGNSLRNTSRVTFGSTVQEREDSPVPSTSTEEDFTDDYVANNGVPGRTRGGLGDTRRIPAPGTRLRPPSPVSHIDGENPHDTQSNSDKKEEKDNKKKAAAFWDVCRVIAREQRAKDVHEERSLQVIKTLTYFLLFCVLLWCAVCQKISLMILASPQYDRIGLRTRDDRDEDALVAAGRHILLTLAILIPYFLVFLTSLFKWMFGSMTFPTKATLITCFVVEFLHTAGLCILCFLILPELEMGHGIMLMSGVALVPAILYPVCTSASKISNQENQSGEPCCGGAGRKIGVFVLNLFAILVQCAYMPLVLLTDHFKSESTTDNVIWEMTLFIVAMICISFSWWENFVDDRFCGPTGKKGGWHEFILSVKFDLQESRPIVSFFMSVWKIGLTILLSWIAKEYLPINTDDRQRFIAETGLYELLEKLVHMPIKMNASIITLTLASFVGHYVGQTACKLKLQRFSYNWPLILSTPIAVIIVSLDCTKSLDLLSVFTDEQRSCPADDSYEDQWYHYAAGFLVFLSIYWIGRHIFYPNIERLAKTERLYLNPFYCGILFEQHLVLNRRRHNRKVKKDIKDDKSYFRLSNYDSRMNVEGEEEDDRSEHGQTEDVLHDKYYNPKFRDVPMIYACATMWHENRQEMMQLMKSIFRMDRDQCIRKHAEMITQKEDKEFYDFEAHILFDDAMELNDNDEMEPNQFVKLMMSVMDEAASSVYEKFMNVKPPFKVPSPYGGQLIFTLPGDNFMFIHLKDKQKIRHRKRWSQVMYMYYLLGFRIVRMCQETVTAALNDEKIHELMNWQDTREIGRSHIFQAFDEQVIRKANNTFLLALDGDVDFTPGAVRLLLDRMRKSEKVGAACGRIHPIGSGPIVWFQKFEYAIAHWLQKATEHVLGCVLCSPGCFSLFRGSALMDDNIMKKYTILPTEASHHLMYDQGEDRWLCTLLLQQGYRVDYAAGSDAFTYAPEGFAEFFNQRRRWMPSTVANIIDLLADYKNTVYANSNISMLYIFYQASLLLSTIVGPATVLMMIAGAGLVVFKVSLWESYLIALIPAIFYFSLCFVVKTKWQILVAEIMTGFYSFIMMIVLVGTVVTAAQESPMHPSVIFLAFLGFIFVFAAVLHPKEWTCVIFGVLYFLLVPTGFLLLIFYSLCNMHNVSWGTREVPKKKTAAEIEEEKKKLEAKKKKKEKGFWGRIFPQSPIKDLKELLTNITAIQGPKKVADDDGTTELLKEISKGINQLVGQKTGDVKVDMDGGKKDTDDNTNLDKVVVDGNAGKTHHGILKKTTEPTIKHKSVGISDSVRIVNDDSEEPIYDRIKKRRDELKNPSWADCKELGEGAVLPMVGEELTFWTGFIDKYLKPLELSSEQKKNISKSLIELRNNVCLGMAMINLLWIAVNFMFQLNSPTKIKLKLTSNTNDLDDLEENLNEEEDTDNKTADNIISVDILGMLFIFFFLVILLLQFVGMLIHRWGTFMHLVSVTQLKNPFEKLKKAEVNGNNKDIDSREAIKIVETMLWEPLPDYPSDDEEDSDDEDANEARQELENLAKTGSRFRVSHGRPNILGASTRQLGKSTTGDTTALNKMGRSAKIVQDALRVTNKNTHAPNKVELQVQMQDEYIKKRDSKYKPLYKNRNASSSKYKDRPLPAIGRYNLGAGKSDLQEMLKERNMLKRTEGRRELVEENEDPDGIYDVLKPKGTIGRQIGKKMKLFAKTSAAGTVRFSESSGGVSNGNRYRVSRGSESAEMY